MNSSKVRVFDIDPRKIDVIKGFNKRKDFGDLDELAAQIKEQGLLEPISVIPYNKDGEDRFLLLNGERRYRSIMKLMDEGEEISTIPANVLEDGEKLSDADLYIQQFIRNEGKKFNDVEFGYLCKTLKDLGLSNSEIGKRLGKNPGVVSYALQSLDYDPRIREMIENGEIGGTEVRRMYTAARKTHGKDWEEKANEQILAMREAANAASENSGKPAKVSIKNNDLYGDVKDTKAFLAGMKALRNYIRFYQNANKGVEFEIDIMDMYEKLTENDKLTLRDMFVDIVDEARKHTA